MSKKTIENEYKKISQRDHILIRPDTYVGPVTEQSMLGWFIGENKAEKKIIKYVPALVKCFDEILTNASDHSQREGKNVKNIWINWNEKEGWIEVKNDGKGIPVVIHKDENVLLPEMIFGNLLTGSNFNDDEERFGAGRNGYGAKLANVFSTEFILETHDSKKGYIGKWTDNMSVYDKGNVFNSKHNFTRIRFKPDVSKLNNCDPFSKDHIDLYVRRAYDCAAYTGVNVYVQNEKIEVKNFKDWVGYFGNVNEDITKPFIEIPDEYWSIAIGPNDEDVLDQLSVVNGNTTWLGGTHISYAVDQVVKKLTEIAEKQNKGIKIRSVDIRNKLKVFVMVRVPNPTFSTQTKEFLTSGKFATTPLLSTNFLKKLADTEIMERINELIRLREAQELKKLNTQTRGKLRIDKLEDANKAGTPESSECALILTEGDSARSTAIAGLSIVGRDYYGVFPLKGKVLNVREIPIKRLLDNKEISNIVTILGLQPGKNYKSLSELRYGKLIMMTDADCDGVHIKALLINFIHYFWPELLEMGFVLDFITPIIKAKKDDNVISFYNQKEYDEWRNKTDIKDWKIKYYKGLGTSSGIEAKEYFSNLKKHLIKINYLQEESDIIDKAFNKNRSEDRKEWISSVLITNID